MIAAEEYLKFIPDKNYITQSDTVGMFLRVLVKHQLDPNFIQIKPTNFDTFMTKGLLDIEATSISFIEGGMILDIFQYAERSQYHAEPSWIIPKATLDFNMVTEDVYSIYTDRISNIEDAELILDSIIIEAKKYLTKENIDLSFLPRYLGINCGLNTMGTFLERLFQADRKSILPYLTHDFLLSEIIIVDKYRALPFEDYVNWKDAPEEWVARTWSFDNNG